MVAGSDGQGRNDPSVFGGDSGKVVILKVSLHTGIKCEIILSRPVGYLKVGIGFKGVPVQSVEDRKKVEATFEDQSFCLVPDGG